MLSPAVVAIHIAIADDAQLQALGEQVALANGLLHRYGLGAYQGHVSARLPDSDLVLLRTTPVVSLGRVGVDDLMLIDINGTSCRRARAIWGASARGRYRQATLHPLAQPRGLR